jgi:hypothetical protein
MIFWVIFRTMTALAEICMSFAEVGNLINMIECLSKPIPEIIKLPNISLNSATNS